MKRLLALIILILLIQPAGALLNIDDILPSAMSHGIDRALKDQTDNLYEMFGMQNTTFSNTVANTLIQPNTFIQNKFVQSQKDFNAGWFFIAWVMFVILGGIKLFDEMNEHQDNYGDRNRSTWRVKYLGIIIGSILIYFSYLWLFQKLFELEYALSYGMFLQTMDTVYVPNSGTAYFAYGILHIILSIFGEVRYIIIAIITGSFLLLYTLRLAGFEEIFNTAIWYGLLLLFGRTLIIGIVYFGFGILNSIPADSPVLDSAIGASSKGYLVVLGLCALIILMILFYPVKLILFGGRKVKYYLRG